MYYLKVGDNNNYNLILFEERTRKVLALYWKRTFTNYLENVEIRDVGLKRIGQIIVHYFI